MLKYHRIIRGIVQGNALRAPYRLNMSLTNLCDSRCKTCDIWQIYPQKRFNVRNELRVDEFRRIFRRLPSSVMWISYSGGEPHLRKDFPEIMEACFAEVRNIAMVNVPNNGLQRRRCVNNWDQILSIKKRPFVYISMSLDGPRDIHDEVRGVEGNFDSAMGALEDIRSIIAREGNAEIGVGLTISKFNYGKVMPLVHEVVRQGLPLKIEAAYAGDLYYQGDPGERPILQASGVSETVREIYDLLCKKQWNPFSARHFLERSHVRGTLKFLANPNRLVLPCRASHTSFAIDCYGNVNPCFFYSPGLGNLRDFDYDLMDLVRAGRTRIAEAQETIRKHECPRCWLVCNSLESMVDRKLRAPWRRFGF